MRYRFPIASRKRDTRARSLRRIQRAANYSAKKLKHKKKGASSLLDGGCERECVLNTADGVFGYSFGQIGFGIFAARCCAHGCVWCGCVGVLVCVWVRACHAGAKIELRNQINCLIKSPVALVGTINALMRDSKQQSAKHFITPLGVVIQLSVLGTLGAKHCQTASIYMHYLCCLVPSMLYLGSCDYLPNGSLKYNIHCL